MNGKWHIQYAHRHMPCNVAGFPHSARTISLSAQLCCGKWIINCALTLGNYRFVYNLINERKLHALHCTDRRRECTRCGVCELLHILCIVFHEIRLACYSNFLRSPFLSELHHPCGYGSARAPNERVRECPQPQLQPIEPSVLGPSKLHRVVCMPISG